VDPGIWVSVTFGANECPAQLDRQQPWAVEGPYRVSQHAEALFRSLLPTQEWKRNADPGALQPYASKVTENLTKGSTIIKCAKIEENNNADVSEEVTAIGCFIPSIRLVVRQGCDDRRDGRCIARHERGW